MYAIANPTLIAVSYPPHCSLSIVYYYLYHNFDLSNVRVTGISMGVTTAFATVLNMRPSQVRISKAAMGDAFKLSANPLAVASLSLSPSLFTPRRSFTLDFTGLR